MSTEYPQAPVPSASAGLFATTAVLAAFFVMGFIDVIGTAMNYVKTDFSLSPLVAGFLPFMINIWFLVASVPAGMLATRFGRRRTVMLSLVLTLAGLLLVTCHYALWSVFASFALLGIGNTVLQAALPALMKNVASDAQLTSRLTLGQFVKALCAAVSPLLAGYAALSLGNWKLIFPIYAAITVAEAVFLLAAPVPRETPVAGPATTFGGCLALLADPYVLLMFLGIFFVVGADVGLNCAIPPFLQDVCHLDSAKAGMGPTVYFVAKTAGSFVGALVLARCAAARCFPFSVLLGLVGAAGMFFTRDATLFLVCVAVASLGISNVFGMIFGLAMTHRPDRANEISGLMVMAISGGAVLPPVMGYVQGLMGPAGLVAVLVVCLLYLLGLSFFAVLMAGGRKQPNN